MNEWMCCKYMNMTEHDILHLAVQEIKSQSTKSLFFLYKTITEQWGQLHQSISLSNTALHLLTELIHQLWCLWCFIVQAQHRQHHKHFFTAPNTNSSLSGKLFRNRIIILFILFIQTLVCLAVDWADWAVCQAWAELALSGGLQSYAALSRRPSSPQLPSPARRLWFRGNFRKMAKTLKSSTEKSPPSPLGIHTKLLVADCPTITGCQQQDKLTMYKCIHLLG